MRSFAHHDATRHRQSPGFLTDVQPSAPGNPEILDIAWDALRFPGMRHSIPATATQVPGLYPATAALCRALMHTGQTLWIDQPPNSLLYQWCRHHAQARLVSLPDAADFTIVTTPSLLPSLYRLNIGDGANPATATTLLIQVPGLRRRGELHWYSDSDNAITPDWIQGLPPTFWHQREELQQMLPWGIDIFFIHDGSFVALPRRVRVTTGLPA